MNWYNFLGNEYSFNAILCHLIAPRTLKSQNIFGLAPPKTPLPHYPRHQAAITIALQPLFPLNKTKSSSTKQTLVKVLG